MELLTCTLLCLCALISVAVAGGLAPDSIPSPEQLSKLPFEARLKKALVYIRNNETLEAAYNEHLLTYENSNPIFHGTSEVKFPCDLKQSSTKPTSVHRLQPGDIDVVAGMGDSITGGNGIEAKTAIGVLTQWRGDSWSIGGDQTWVERRTIPNFLRTINPKLVGYSLGTGDKDNPNAHLNVAKAGATADNIPIQARMLVDRLKTEPGVDFENDWKLVTLFIGGNDICDCDLAAHNPDSYKAKIMEGLDILHAEVPRAFVNLVEVLDVSQLADLNDGIVCSVLHVFLCPCGAYPLTDARRKNVEVIAKAFQATIEEIVGGGRYDTRDDFTVVHQPFFRHTEAPRLPNNKFDMRFFAPDCFHFSERGHAGAAEALWNNMVEPVGMKRTEWRIGEPLECPTSAYPYFSTSKNSAGAAVKAAAAPNQLGANAPKSGPSLLGVQNVGGAGVQQGQDQGAGDSSGLSTTSAVILACTLTVFVVLVVAFVARRTLKRKNQYERVPDMSAVLVDSRPPKYT